MKGVFFPCGLLAIAITVPLSQLSCSSSVAQETSERPSQEQGKAVRVVDIEHCRLQFVQQATLASRQPGILKFVKPNEGTPVQAEAVVAELEDGVARAQLAIAEAETKNKVDILYAGKAAEVAASELERARQANRDVKGTVPDIEIQRLKLAHERSKLQIKVAEHQQVIKGLTHQLRQAELDAHQVKAPFTGLVTRVFKHKGEAVVQGEPILEIVNPERIRAEASIPLEQSLSIRKGDRVDVLLDLKNVELTTEEKTLKGHVVFIDVSVNPVSRKVRVWAVVAAGRHLPVAGLTGRLRIYASALSPKKK